MFPVCKGWARGSMACLASDKLQSNQEWCCMQLTSRCKNEHTALWILGVGGWVHFCCSMQAISEQLDCEVSNCTELCFALFKALYT